MRRRNAAVAPDSGTATIRGKITNAKTGSPLKDVQVMMRLLGHGEVAGSAKRWAVASLSAARQGLPEC